MTNIWALNEEKYHDKNRIWTFSKIVPKLFLCTEIMFQRPETIWKVVSRDEFDSARLIAALVCSGDHLMVETRTQNGGKILIIFDIFIILIFIFWPQISSIWFSKFDLAKINFRMISSIICSKYILIFPCTASEASARPAYSARASRRCALRARAAVRPRARAHSIK